MVIEVVVNDNDIDEVADLEPDVTVNGGNLKMIQAGDGNWYAYIVQNHSSYGQTELFGDPDGLRLLHSLQIILMLQKFIQMLTL